MKIATLCQKELASLKVKTDNEKTEINKTQRDYGSVKLMTCQEIHAQ